jgi:hypothetical protein
MQCYFQRDGHLAGVEMLPLGLSDEDAIARAHTLSSKRRRPFDGFEVWDRARFVFADGSAAGGQHPWADDCPERVAQRHGSQNDRLGTRVSLGEVRASFSTLGNR